MPHLEITPSAQSRNQDISNDAEMLRLVISTTSFDKDNSNDSLYLQRDGMDVVDSSIQSEGNRELLVYQVKSTFGQLTMIDRVANEKGEIK